MNCVIAMHWSNSYWEVPILGKTRRKFSGSITILKLISPRTTLLRTHAIFEYLALVPTWDSQVVL